MAVNGTSVNLLLKGAALGTCSCVGTLQAVRVRQEALTRYLRTGGFPLLWELSLGLEVWWHLCLSGDWQRGPPGEFISEHSLNALKWMEADELKCHCYRSPLCQRVSLLSKKDAACSAPCPPAHLQMGLINSFFCGVLDDGCASAAQPHRVTYTVPWKSIPGHLWEVTFQWTLTALLQKLLRRVFIL